MIDIAKSYEKDKAGNHWYLEQLLSSNGCSLKRLLNGKSDFDMSDDDDKALALTVCTPLSTVIDKIGSFFSNGKYYVTDIDGNESPKHDDIRNLLKRPNLLQTGKQFSKQIEMSLKLFGYCPIFTLRATTKALPTQMWIIPPELFHLVSTGKLFKQKDLKEIIERAYIKWGNIEIELNDGDYFIIYDSEAQIYPDTDEVIFRSPTNSLSFPVSLWVNQMIASNTLIVDGGPKGIVHNKDTTELGNSALTSKEADKLNSKFQSKYGLVNKEFSILVTKANIGWVPLNYDAGQLKLHEEDKRCSEMISNAIGINPDLFSSGSKYENKSAAEREAYNGLIIPDSEIVCEALTHALCPEGVTITMDYSHISALQKDKQAESTALLRAANAVTSLWDKGIITKEESRIEISKYIEINPDEPKGEYINEDE